MILPCRIHRIRSHIDSLPLALLFAAFLLSPHNEAMGQYGAGGSTSEAAGAGGGVTFRLKSHPVLISATTITLSGATLPQIQTAKAHFSQKKTSC